MLTKAFEHFFKDHITNGRKNLKRMSARETSRTIRPDFTSNLVCGLTFGTPKVYIVPYGKINHRLVNLNFNFDAKSGQRCRIKIQSETFFLYTTRNNETNRNLPSLPQRCNINAV